MATFLLGTLCVLTMLFLVLGIVGFVVSAMRGEIGPYGKDPDDY